MASTIRGAGHGHNQSFYALFIEDRKGPKLVIPEVRSFKSLMKICRYYSVCFCLTDLSKKGKQPASHFALLAAKRFLS